MIGYAKTTAQHLIIERALSNEGRLLGKRVSSRGAPGGASQETDEHFLDAAREHSSSELAFAEDRLHALQQLGRVQMAAQYLSPAELEAFQRHLDWLLSCMKSDGRPAEMPRFTEAQRRALDRARTRLKKILKEMCPHDTWPWDLEN
jgi:hypothetical protein